MFVIACPGLYPLDASSISQVVAIKNVSRYCQMFGKGGGGREEIT